MLIFALKRVLSAVPTLLILLMATFFLLRLAPGGPFDTDRAWPPEIQANINHRYELDRPVAVQFAHWLRDVAKGDLRESFQYIGRPVAEIIEGALPASLGLGAAALAVAIITGAWIGCLCAWGRGGALDFSATFLAIAGLSMPTYLLASLLVIVFALELNWLPPALLEEPSAWILPVITLSVRPAAMIARLTRASMIEALDSDYIRTAYGKGLSPSVVVFKHALKNSLIPILTLLGPLTAQLVTGSFLVEVVFQLPGLGKHFVQAVINRDYPLVMGVTLVYGIILIGANLTVDVLYGKIDPRIRLGQDW